MEMPVLRDCTDEGTRAEFHFISRIPGKYEGCQINFKFVDSNRFIYDLNFGWTNLTIRNYITVTTEFPLDTLNGFKLDGLYMSFEKHLYQLSWRKSQSEGIYELGFLGSDQDFTLMVDIESVRKFGSQFKLAWDQAPIFD
jgi:hypothetical protein